jgi:transcriptional regulator with PAS, ATPase and Fis domain
VVSKSGQLVGVNGPAHRVFGLAGSDGSLGALSEVAPELWPPLRQALERRAGTEEVVTLPGASAGGQSVRCRIDPIARDGRAIGSAIILTDAPGGAGRPRRRRELGPSSRRTSRNGFADIIGGAPALREALSLARAAARSPHARPMLIVGESGTGKELVAHAIHAESGRAGGPFVAVNCGALPRELVESELFGYAPGAFTGARPEGYPGRFQAAHGGTIFLDEIDSVPLELQAKFLRILEDGEVMRLGDARPVRVDVRVVAASSVELGQRVREGRFRLDLFHRLGVVEIVLPPLRERGPDVLLLARAFLEQECAGAGRPRLGLSAAAADCLTRYDWPGNVRELQNLCSRLVLTVSAPEIQRDHLPTHIRDRVAAASPAAVPGASLRQAQDALIQRTLQDTGGDVAGAARRLGIAKTTIYRRLRRLSKAPSR